MTVQVQITAGGDDGYLYNDLSIVSDQKLGAVGRQNPDDTQVEYTDAFFRFASVAVPVGATITSAYLSLVSSNTSEFYTSGFNAYIRGRKVANCPAMTDATTYKNTTTYPWTTASVAWWPTKANWIPTATRTSPDLKTVIQEIIDHDDWASGNAIQLSWYFSGVWEPEVYTGDVRSFYAYEDTVYDPPTLTIEYTGGSTPIEVDIMKVIKQSTKTDVLVGPLVDDTDFKSPEESVAYNATGIDVDVIKGITKADITLANSAGDGYWRHVINGYYALTLSTTDTGTLGPLRVTFEATGVLPCWEDFLVVPANVYDAMVAGTDYLKSDAVEISSSTTAANAVESNIGYLDASIADLNDLSAADVNAEVDTALSDYDGPTKAEMDSAFAALNDISAADVNAEVDLALADYDPPTKAELDAGLAGITAPSASDVADAVWDEAQAGHTTAGTFGLYLDTRVSSVSGTSGSPGSGANSCTMTITAGGAGVPGATVWVTTDAAGSTVVAEGKRTNDSGQVTLLLDAGSVYYLWAQCPAGYSDIQGEPFTAVAD